MNINDRNAAAAVAKFRRGELTMKPKSEKLEAPSGDDFQRHYRDMLSDARTCDNGPFDEDAGQKGHITFNVDHERHGSSLSYTDDSLTIHSTGTQVSFQGQDIQVVSPNFETNPLFDGMLTVSDVAPDGKSLTSKTWYFGVDPELAPFLEGVATVR